LKIKRGFTLIELIVVVSILGVLLVIAMPVYTNYIARTYIARVVNIVPPYQQAVQLYYQLHGVAPTTTTQLNFTGNANVIDFNSGQLPLPDILSKIVFATHGLNPTIEFYIPVANLGLSPVESVTTIVLIYELANNQTTNLLQWTCSFSQGHVEFANFIPPGCT
jgi:prepilin-type N-terminal cleavage/methylation domain-containing protein